MNWDVIKEKYPKAYHNMLKYFNCQKHELIESIADNPFGKNGLWVTVEGVNEIFNFDYVLRVLYDFFDDNILYISVAKDGTIFVADIKNEDDVLFTKYKKCNRKDIELVVFEKAFEILEGKI